ncbi:hypothetical protein DSLPV1_097 [Dishui lake phycodnavirus 1]|uniref:hypothetical protein n=1 Tax=Dishui lake phycodnavirus 1 TaxID=2079134 RepID=UPI000CD6958B|nr:hypothetical protein C5Y57_gp097 [Dishui lake phycodnavirus 1]AUT19068.1 hypothetical protein DSLPV1_097 [Dishui lake phycodnavirus 1]
MILNLLTYGWGLYRRLTTPRDYEIYREDLEYYVDPSMKFQTDDLFWESESHHWASLHALYSDVRGKKYRMTDVPQCVTKLLIRIKYWYHGRKYTMITDDINFTFPPESKSGSMMFTLPIVKAVLLDHDDKPVRDVTTKITRAAGPKYNFHNQRVALRDVLFFDDGVLEREYPKIKVTNAIGQSSMSSTLTDYTTDLLRFC